MASVSVFHGSSRSGGGEDTSPDTSGLRQRHRTYQVPPAAGSKEELLPLRSSRSTSGQVATPEDDSYESDSLKWSSSAARHFRAWLLARPISWGILHGIFLAWWFWYGRDGGDGLGGDGLDGGLDVGSVGRSTASSSIPTNNHPTSENCRLLEDDGSVADGCKNFDDNNNYSNTKSIIMGGFGIAADTFPRLLFSGETILWFLVSLSACHWVLWAIENLRVLVGLRRCFGVWQFANDDIVRRSSTTTGSSGSSNHDDKNNNNLNNVVPNRKNNDIINIKDAGEDDRNTNSYNITEGSSTKRGVGPEEMAFVNDGHHGFSTHDGFFGTADGRLVDWAKWYRVFKSIVFSASGLMVLRLVLALICYVGSFVCLLMASFGVSSSLITSIEIVRNCWTAFWLTGMQFWGGGIFYFSGFSHIGWTGARFDPTAKLLVINHATILDGVLLMQLCETISFVSLKQNLAIPGFAGIVRAVDAIVVDQREKDSRIHVMKAIDEWAKAKPGSSTITTSNTNSDTIVPTTNSSPTGNANTNSNTRVDDNSAVVNTKRPHVKPGYARQLMVFPEGTTTNHCGLIGFKKGAFNPGEPVQPCCVRWVFHPTTGFNGSWVAHRERVSFGNVGNRVATTSSTQSAQSQASAKETAESTAQYSSVPPNPLHLLLGLCGQFVNRLEVKVLPKYTPSAEEKASPSLYAENVRRLMARHLELPVAENVWVEDLNHVWKVDVALLKKKG